MELLYSQTSLKKISQPISIKNADFLFLYKQRVVPNVFGHLSHVHTDVLVE